MLTIAAFVLVLGVLVFVHEAGHFVAARAAGIRVLRFSFGFGKVLFGVRRGGTEYVVSALPLGGYVKMAGGEESDATGAPDEFLSKPPLVRAMVAFAGPAMNFVLAVLVYAAVAKVGYTVYTFPNRVGAVMREIEIAGRRTPAPAAAAGFQPGDEVKAIAGRPARYWFELQKYVAENAGKETAFTVRRGGKELTLRATPLLEPDSGRGLIGLMPYQDPRVSAVAPGGAAAAAGVVVGDTVVRLDGRPVNSFTDVVLASEGLEVGWHSVTFANRGCERVARVRYDGRGAESFIAALGVECGVVPVRVAASWGAAFPEGARQTWDVVKATARVFGWLVKGHVKVTKALGGPITMARVAGATARAGAVTFLSYIGYLSVMLAIINLLPVPVLDGGHIFIAAVEAARRRRLPARAREVVTLVGLAMVIGLTALALAIDIGRVFGG